MSSGTKVFGIKEQDFFQFIKKINEFYEKHKVFATQTHYQRGNESEICECNHHTRDHSYNPDFSTNLRCDICGCQEFKPKNLSKLTWFAVIYFESEKKFKLAKEQEI